MLPSSSRAAIRIDSVRRMLQGEVTTEGGVRCASEGRWPTTSSTVVLKAHGRARVKFVPSLGSFNALTSVAFEG